MNYESVTITPQSSVPVSGHASQVFVKTMAGNTYIPALETIVVIPKATKYIIAITDLKVDFDVDNPMDILPSTGVVDIQINDTLYTDCRRIGGSIQSVDLIKDSTVFKGTVIYVGYIWEGSAT